MPRFRFWTDAGDQDEIIAKTIEHAAIEAAKKIPTQAWEDGAWGWVADDDGYQLRVHQIDDEPYTHDEQDKDQSAVEAIEKGAGIPHPEIEAEFGKMD